MVPYNTVRLILRCIAGSVVLLLSLGCIPTIATAVEVCTGDCSGDGTVTVDELVRGTNIALGTTGVSQCSILDANSDQSATVDELVTAVHRALDGCPAGPSPVWYPAVSYPSLPEPGPRGLLDRRGLIHAHSVYSHDACDNQPMKDGVPDAVCFDDFRRGLCQSKHDYVMLTDHNRFFSDTPYPEALLYRPERGDQLIQRDDKPVASWAGCPDGSHALILAGTESATMPVGLEEHVADEGERSDIYNDVSADAIEKFHAQGAVSLLQHTEDWLVSQLRDLPIDGFEMYNVHANLILNAGKAFQALVRLNDPGFIYPDLVLLLISSEDKRYLTRWGSVLASGQKRVTTMATDCHRNTFQQLMQDGERVDSYRRMMRWFSNHLLVQPKADGSWDDRDLKDALRAGRLYGAFELMGFPEGFDYHAEVGGQMFEMGGEVQLADQPILHVSRPSVRYLDPNREAPQLRLRILRAKEGGFDEVATGTDTLAFSPTQAGAYRAEVRMVPLHLREDLGDDAATLLAQDFVWIYGNAIYVR